MDGDKLKKQIGVNIATYRKQARMTQAELAQRLNYSDKAVSKWERGESAPDVTVLAELAQLFDVSVEMLLRDPNALPENPGKIERVMGRAVEKTLKRKADKRIILGLSSLLVWFLALLAVVTGSFFHVPQVWAAFAYAVPANAVVILALCCAWKDHRHLNLWISLVMWGGLLSAYASVLAFVSTALYISFLRIFLLGIPGQVAIHLWTRKLWKSVPEEPHE